ncbi:MAG: heme ABC exporter ATP-binding protein CcmA [Anaerolineae bacterium]|nr:heme ABC exporter ATP-binding protein CcmA [Anaerolineae bacterium]
MATTDNIIVATDLVKAFGLRPILRGLTFTVRRGTLVSLLGLNGSGKTTLLRILSALSRPTSGTVTIGGWNLPKEAAAIRSQLGVVSHLPLLYDDLTAEENLRFFARLYNLEKPEQRVAEVLEQVGLGKRGKDLLRTFSRGMQQRLAIARATLHDPAILLLDEPYTGLDVGGANMLDDFIRLWKSTGRTIIMSSHDMEHAAQFSDYVLLIHQGKIALDGPMDAIDDLPTRFAAITNTLPGVIKP